MKTNEVMRLDFLGYNLATEVVLSGKLGGNEVFKFQTPTEVVLSGKLGKNEVLKPCRINNNKNKPSNI